MKKICVILVDRANYGRMFPVMHEISSCNELKLQTLCAGTMLLERFGSAEKIVLQDGFDIDGRVYLELEGSTPTTMTKSIGMGIIEFSSEFQRLKPDIVLLIGDRYEALSAAIATAYMNITLAHIQGGEVSGSIDESTRHAISKFAHLHFPSTQRSAEYLKRMGESPANIHNVGCPSGDYILQLNGDLPVDAFNHLGVGHPIDAGKPFLLVIFHSVTTEYGNEIREINQLISALSELKFPTLWIWPNIDAGSDHISKALRVYREKEGADSSWLRLVKNLDPITYQKALKSTHCAIGNSSSFMRDSTFSGAPVVMVGDRQQGREAGKNLMYVSAQKNEILNAIEQQLEHGRYPVDNLYGSGRTSTQIVQQLKSFKTQQQKILHYVLEHEHPDT